MIPRTRLNGIGLAVALGLAWASVTASQEVPGRLLYDIQGSVDSGFGTAVAGGRDLNGDGVADFAVSAPGAGDRGTVFVYSGLDGSPLYVIVGPVTPSAAATRLGNDLAFVSDVDDDDVADLLVSDRDATVFVSEDTLRFRGAAFLFSGANGSLLRVFRGAPEEFGFGFSACAVEDVTEDRLPEFLFSTRSVHDGAGAVRLMTLGGDTLAHLEGDGVNVSSLGLDVAGTGDVDGDGGGDYIVGAPGDVSHPDAGGWVFVVSGKTGTLLYTKGGVRGFGYAVGGPGDVDGDGRPDFSVGTSWGGADSVFVYSGADGRLLWGQEVSPYDVRSLGAGDLNGDGRPDLIVGTRGSGANEDYYRLFILSGSDGTRLMPLKSAGYSVSGLEDVDGDGRPESIGSDPNFPGGYHLGRVLIHGIPPVPSIPGGCTATGDQIRRIEFTWMDVSGETGFGVYRDGALVGTNAPDDTTYSDDGLQGTHEYCVRAINEGGNSDPCCAFGTALTPPPPAPPYCDASDTGAVSVLVAWGDVVDETGYRVYRDGVLRGQTDADVIQFTDPAPPGTYQYCVTAFNGSGESAATCASGTVIAAPPAPSGFVAGDSSYAVVLLRWVDVPGETGFRITRDGSPVATLPRDATSWEDYPPVGTYEYCIRAFNVAGDSPPSCDTGTRLLFNPRTCPKIMVHLRTPVAKNRCALSTTLTDCRDAAVDGELGRTYYAYVIVADYDPVRGLAGVQFGVDYDRAPGSGVDIFDWTSCATLQFPSTGGTASTPITHPGLGGGHHVAMLGESSSGEWYAGGGGNLLTWDWTRACRRDAVTAAGYFYMAAYSPDRLSIVPRQVDGMARTADCAGEATTLPTREWPTRALTLGSAGFGGIPGLNPCLNPLTGPEPCSAVAEGEGIRFSWSTVGWQWAFLVYRDGVILRELPGDVYSHLDFPGPGTHAYAVEAAAGPLVSEPCERYASVTSSPVVEGGASAPALVLAVNPSRAPVDIRYRMSGPGRVTIGVYAIAGRLVRTLLDEERPEGLHEAAWDGRDSGGVPVARGVYLIQLRSPGGNYTAKVLLAR